MVKIPVKYKFAAVFDEGARVIRSCESSGSEHSAADLSDLVNSFLEREIREQRAGDHEEVEQDIDNLSEINDDESNQINPPDLEFQESLKKLFDHDNINDSVKRSIYSVVGQMLGEVAGEKHSPPPDFKRRLMARLRDRGFDAGLCKSKWEKNGRTPSGNYEYIDVNAGGSRYIVEVFLAGEFTIARPTGCYASMLDIFPQIFVGKPDDLKQVTRLMSRAIRKSMKSVDLNIPPWRRLAYMQAKWFGSYKRTTNETPSWKPPCIGRNVAGDHRLLGFVPRPAAGVTMRCRGNFAAKHGIRVGNLAAALNQKEMLL